MKIKTPLTIMNIKGVLISQSYMLKLGLDILIRVQQHILNDINMQFKMFFYELKKELFIKKQNCILFTKNFKRISLLFNNKIRRKK